MKKKGTIINNTLLNQQKLLELLIIVIILAVGINLISNQLPDFFKIDSLTTIAIGILFCIMGIIFLIKQVLDNRKLIREYEGFFVYDEGKNLIMDIPEYQFSKDMVSSIDAVFLENINLKKIWDSKPLMRSSLYDYEQNPSKTRNAIKMINELTEYLILEKLSTHLTDHFNNKQIPKDVLKIYERVDVPDILLKNRFLEIISHPMDERPIFDDDRGPGMEGHEIVSSSGPDGALYHRFACPSA